MLGGNVSADIPIPDEVVAFLAEAQELNNADLGINILSAEQSRSYSEALHGFSATAELGLVALDDANDSNPYCYISNGPAAGMVLHYTHDGAPQIKFESLAAFRAALAELPGNGTTMWDLPFEEFEPVGLVSALGSEAAALLSHPDSDHAEFLLCLYMPHTPLEDAELVKALAGHVSFFVREAVAVAIAERPTPELLAVAERLAEDEHPQVARPGKKALGAVKRTVYESRA